MRTFIVFLLSCVSAFAADKGVRFVSTVTTTNETGVYATETFTRGSQTNLVRTTKTQGGDVVYRRHDFYHHGDLVAVIAGTPDPVGFFAEPGLPYYVSLEFLPSKDVRVLRISGEDFYDAFYATNGIYYPAPDSDLGNQDTPPVGTFGFGATLNHEPEYLWSKESDLLSRAFVTNLTSFNITLFESQVDFKESDRRIIASGSSYPWNGKEITISLAPNGVAMLPFWIPGNAQAFKISFDFKENGGPLHGRYRSSWMPNSL